MFDIEITTEYGNFGHFKDLLCYMKDENLNDIDVSYSIGFSAPINQHWTLSQVDFIVNNKEEL